MNKHGFKFAWAALIVVGVSWVAAVPFYFIFNPPARVVTVPTPPLSITKDTTLEEVNARLGPFETRVPAQQINNSLSGSCDIWQSNSWVLFLCH